MKMKFLIWVLLELGAGNAMAEITAPTTTEPKTPTVITSDGPMEVDYSKKIAVFDENVFVNDPQGTVRADHMEVYFDKETNDIDQIYCKGDVKIHHQDRTSHSDEAVYETKEQKIILTGNPEILQGLDRYRAEKITIFTAENRVIFEPSAQLLVYPKKEDGAKNDLFSPEDDEDDTPPAIPAISRGKEE